MCSIEIRVTGNIWENSRNFEWTENFAEFGEFRRVSCQFGQNQRVSTSFYEFWQISTSRIRENSMNPSEIVGLRRARWNCGDFRRVSWIWPKSTSFDEFRRISTSSMNLGEFEESQLNRWASTSSMNLRGIGNFRRVRRIRENFINFGKLDESERTRRLSALNSSEYFWSAWISFWVRVLYMRTI